MKWAHATWLLAVTGSFVACAGGTSNSGAGGAGIGGDTTSIGGGTSDSATSGSGTGGGKASSTASSSASSGVPGTCVTKADCAAIADACNDGNCVNGMCAKAPANDGADCDDGLYCTENDACQGGMCVSGSQKFCPSPDTCHVGSCDEASKSCTGAPGNDGASCDDGDPCTYSGTCSAGTCSKGLPVDCSNFNGTCADGVCDPILGCQAKPKNDGASCDDGLYCTVMDVCTLGVCSGVPNTCAAPGDVCKVGVCNEAQKTCVAQPGNNGAACNDQNACTAGETCSNGLCGGGGPANNGGVCDDHNACTTGEKCGNGLCGSGLPVVACVNGDGCCPQGCTVVTDDDCGGTVYMSSSNGTSVFEAYDVTTNAWTTLQSAPKPSYTQLASDGKVVFSLGSDDVVYSYDPKTKVWSTAQPGPGPEASQPIGLFRWTPQGLYYLKDGGPTLKVSVNAGAWQTITLPTNGSSAGSYDPATGRLYIRAYSNMGVIVFDTVTNTVVKLWPNATSVGENSRTGAFFGGFFYERDWALSLVKVDMTTGVAMNLAVTPAEAHTSTDVDMVTGDIFIGPYSPTGSTFQVYNANTNMLKTLASAPIAITNHSTVVLSR